MRRKKERGFSLIEMMTVVAILLILGGIATPALIRSIRRYQLESACRQIGSILVRTRYEAIRRNRRISTVFKPPAGGVSGGQLGIDYNSNGQLDVGEPRAVVDPKLFLWIYPGTSCCPQWVQWPDYTSVPVGGNLTFAPDGTMVQQVGANWQIATSIQGVYMSNWPDPAVWSNWQRFEIYIVSVTPGGRVRSWRLANTPPWGYQPMF